MNIQPRTQNRALALALEDWKVTGKRPDSEIAQEWGIGERQVREIRATEEYRLVLSEIREQTISNVGERLAEVHAAALENVKEAVVSLGNRTREMLEPPPGAPPDWRIGVKALTAATAAVRTLYDIASRGRDAEAKDIGSRAQNVMPNLIVAVSNTANITGMMVPVRVQPQEDFVEGEVIPE